MKKQYFLNAAIIDPKNSLDEMGGLIVSEEGKIEAVGKKVNKNNIPSREKFIDLNGRTNCWDILSPDFTLLWMGKLEIWMPSSSIEPFCDW